MMRNPGGKDNRIGIAANVQGRRPTLAAGATKKPTRRSASGSLGVPVQPVSGLTTRLTAVSSGWGWMLKPRLVIRRNILALVDSTSPTTAR